MVIEEFYKLWTDKSIAVVGNGEIANELGKEIDSHDIVIRFNLCIIDGHEKNVGSKTSVCCVGGFSLFDTVKELSDFDVIFSLYPKDIKYNKKSNMHLPDEFYWHDTREVLKCRKPTTGFRLLYHMYRNKIKADVYGFDFYSSKSYYTEEMRKRFEYFRRNLYKKYKMLRVYMSRKDARKKCIDGFHVDSVHKPDAEKIFWEEVNWHNFKS
jgi:hypothetical protein